MRVVLDLKVQEKIESFYSISMTLHPTLDIAIVRAKKKRLFAALRELSKYATIYPLARVKDNWVEQGYREMICEDFHFAFDFVDLETDETIIYVFDAEHSLLNHN